MNLSRYKKRSLNFAFTISVFRQNIDTMSKPFLSSTTLHMNEN